MVQATLIAFSVAATMAVVGGIFFAVAHNNGFVLNIENVAQTFIDKRRRRRSPPPPYVPMERELLRGVHILAKSLDRVRDEDMVALQRRCLALGKGSPWILCKLALQFVQKFSEMEIAYVFETDEARAAGRKFITFCDQKRHNISQMEWYILSNAVCAGDDEERERQLALLDLAVRLESFELLDSKFTDVMGQFAIETLLPDECVLCVTVSARLGYWNDLKALCYRLDEIDPQFRAQFYCLCRERGVADYSVLCQILCEPETCDPPFAPASSSIFSTPQEAPPVYHANNANASRTPPKSVLYHNLEFSQWSVTSHNLRSKSKQIPVSGSPEPNNDKRLTNTSRTLDFSCSRSVQGEENGYPTSPVSPNSLATMSPLRYHHSPIGSERGEPDDLSDKDPCLRIEGHLCLLYGIGEVPMLTGFFVGNRIYVKGWIQGEGEHLHETVCLTRQSSFDEGRVRRSKWAGVYVHSRTGTWPVEISFEVPLDDTAAEERDMVSFSPQDHVRRESPEDHLQPSRSPENYVGAKLAFSS